MSHTYQFDDNFGHKTIISLGLFLMFSVFKNIINFTKWLYAKISKKSERNLTFDFEIIIKYFLDFYAINFSYKF